MLARVFQNCQEAFSCCKHWEFGSDLGMSQQNIPQKFLMGRFMLKMFFRGPSTDASPSKRVAAPLRVAISWPGRKIRTPHFLSSLAMENPTCLYIFDMNVLSVPIAKKCVFPLPEKRRCKTPRMRSYAVLKSTDTSLNSRCNMGMKWVDPLDPPRPPDQIAPLVQLLPQGCVHIF